MTYSLRALDAKNNCDTGYMPILCGSLVNSYCPLKKNQTITYSVPFQLELNNCEMGFLTSAKKFYLVIELFARIRTVPSKTPMFRFVTPIKLRIRGLLDG